ncbi:MAG: tetratricopeptide repeat protein [Galactobacter sp.]|uniref:tetratricopeptide repeat protein n=1 Tax=Galactobacter sp. TaxID=2676125 RepID=UPI0025C659D6|nr:tetratricopeptide repeat protein [Galactobacter sp.]
MTVLETHFALGVPGVEMELPRMRPVVVDENAAMETLRSGEYGDRVVVLIALQRYADAAEAITEARLLDPGNTRLRLLDTEVVRWTGDTDRAVRRLRRILEETAGSADEPEVLHQLGACFYSLGDVRAAVTRFREAWQGREQWHAAEVRQECSRRCYELASASLS